MKHKQTEKGFDCIAFKERVQLEMHEETKEMTPAELVAYLQAEVRKGPFAAMAARHRSLQKDVPVRS